MDPSGVLVLGGRQVEYLDYVSGIRFRLTDPLKGRRSVTRSVGRVLALLGVHLDAVVTRLPVDDSKTKRLLRPVCRMPRMSTFAIAAMINRRVATMPDGQAYVNVGVWHGFTLLAGMRGNSGKRCVGIDSFAQFGGPRAAFLRRFNAARGPLHEFHDLDYADYFRRVHQGPIGLYVYDGPHEYRDQLRGLEVAEEFYAPGCLVLVDDTNWDGPRRATLDFVAARPAGYRVVHERRTAYHKHPTFWNGIMMVQKL